eukprot:Opistho-2@37197
MALAHDTSINDMHSALDPIPATTGEFIPPSPRDCLKNNTIGAMVLKKSPVVDISCTDNIDDALRKLQKHNVTSAPVYDSKKDEYIGLLSTYDLMIYIAFGFFHPDECTIYPGEMEARKADIAGVPVGDLAGTADFVRVGWWDHAGLVVYEPSVSVYEAMCGIFSGSGRALVRTAEGDQFNDERAQEPRSLDHRMLSETDLLRFICQNAVSFHSILGQTIASLSLGEHQPVVSVSMDLPTLSAFRRMFQSRADAVAVVNTNGTIISTLSPSDLRGMRLNSLGDLMLPVSEFLSKRRFGTIAPPLAVSATATLLTAAAVAIMGSVHRVWVIDKCGKPTSAVRVSDMLRAVFQSVADEQ